MTDPQDSPNRPAPEPRMSATRAWHYMLSAFLIGWRKRMDEIRLARTHLPKGKR